MKSEKKVLKIISEEVKLFETEINDHALQRLEQRLDLMSNNGDITQRENLTIRKNLDDVITYDFNPNKSYGIFLGSFVPNPKSKLYTDTNEYNSGIPFYEIYVSDKNEIMKDSTGDEFWAVVRKNRITTVMLRKRLQREFAGNDRMDRGGLGVDFPIFNFDNFKQKADIEKQQQQQKELNKQELNKNLVKIGGVSWEIDNANERIFKKNNPNTFVTFDNFLDYPDWDDNTKEQILNILTAQKAVQHQKI